LVGIIHALNTAHELVLDVPNASKTKLTHEFAYLVETNINQQEKRFYKSLILIKKDTVHRAEIFLR